MILESSSGLPPFFDGYPIDMQLRIYPRGNIFRAELHLNGGRSVPFEITLTTQDVEELNRGLQQEIEQVFNNCEDNGVNDEQILPLVRAGRAAFNRIFADGKPRQYITRALELLCTKKNATIEISTENFFIPWEMLYVDFLSPIKIDCFWGIHYIISRIIVQDASPGSMVSPLLESARPNIGLIICDELDSVIKQEVPALRKLHRNKQIRLLELRSLSTNRQSKEIEFFGRFLRKKLHIAHLACHAYGQDPLDLSFLRISSSFPIAMRDFFDHEFEISHHPLVILNACRTGTINPLYTSSWARLFWKYGARGVLATEFRVPDWFAAAFVLELYEHFLAGKPIGEALLFSRRSFWEKQRNPLGLAYALYSPLAIRIADK